MVEFIIVDNGSTDGTADYLDETASQLGLKVVVVKEPRKGVSRAKNTGFRLSSGEVILLTDDDCYPASDWAQEAARFFANNPECPALAGHVSLFDPDDSPLTITEGIVPPRIRAEDILNASIHGCNIAARRHVFSAVGGFDEHLGPGTPALAAEDKDFLYRIARVFGPVSYRAGMTVAHHHRRKAQETETLWRGYDLGLSALLFKMLTRLDPTALLWLGLYARRRTEHWPGTWLTRPLIRFKTMLGAVVRGSRVYSRADPAVGLR